MVWLVYSGVSFSFFPFFLPFFAHFLIFLQTPFRLPSFPFPPCVSVFLPLTHISQSPFLLFSSLLFSALPPRSVFFLNILYIAFPLFSLSVFHFLFSFFLLYSALIFNLSFPSVILYFFIYSFPLPPFFRSNFSLPLTVL